MFFGIFSGRPNNRFSNRSPLLETTVALQYFNVVSIRIIDKKELGDQLVVVQVKIPEKLSEEQKHLFQKLSETLGSEPVISEKKKGFFESLKDALFE